MAFHLSQDMQGRLRVAKSTVLDDAYLMFEADSNRQYYAGFMAGPDGSSLPALVELDKAKGEATSWKFDDIVSDVFVFESHVSVALGGGATLSLVEGAWKRNSLVLGANSRVVFSDGRTRLIACSPASLSKADTRVGGCESYNPRWKTTFAWHGVRPRVCGDLLYAVTWSVNQNQRLAITLNSGEIVHRHVYAGEDVCARFDS